MLTLHEEIFVPRSPEQCFRYIADFRSATQWDATATRADKLTEGPVGLGSQFELDCAVGPGTIQLVYEIEEYQPYHSLVFRARGRYFDIKDTIVFSARDEGTHIDYTAEFEYRSGLEKIARRFEAPMRAMGARSLAGLKAALTDQHPAPSVSACSRRADQLILPGVAMFTRWGYARGRKQWRPVSRFMDDQHVVITGASSGLGLATSIALAEAGAKLTLVIRNPEGVEDLKNQLSTHTGRSDIRVELADLSLMTDVNALADRFLSRGEPIDVLVNNAGALFNQRTETQEGLERSFALLLLSPWQLTRRLKPLLTHHALPARIINVISGGMYTQRLSCQHLVMPEDNYDGPQAYARAKRGLTVVTELWAEAWREENIVVNAMHPGWADTPGVKSALPAFRRLTHKILRNEAQGADTIIWLARATEADQVSGKLFLDREIRSPYLLKKTIEPPSERQQLEPFLAQMLATVADRRIGH